MKFASRLLPAAIAASLQACVTAPVNAPRAAGIAATPAEQRPPVTILVSIDGFRADYRARGVTPNLNALADAGISAAMRPSFPSVTFPNHWTLVTGLRPDRHGVVGNRMEDARRPGEIFTMATEDSFWWDTAEPLWITAEKAGIRSATMFWPGENVAFGGKRPSDWQQYGHEVTNRQRVDAIIDWLRRPADTRPKFLTLYFDAVDSAGHKFGPDDARTTAVVGEVDAAIGRLRSELAGLGQPVNLVIVADHGMAPISADRVIRLDRQLPAGSFTAIADGPYAAITPTAGHDGEVGAALLTPQPHVTCWRKADMPARLHYGHNGRVPPFVCLAETGWLALTREPPADHPPSGGAHGYDPEVPEMAALFLASGPDVAPRGALAGFDNVDVAPFIRNLLRLPADPSLDGSDAPFRGVRRQ